MRFTVVGAGAIGGLVGGHLAAAGYDVTFVDANADHVAALRADGLRIGGATELTVSADAVDPQDLEGPLEVVLLAVKSRHTTDALDTIAPLLAPDGYVVSLQNGLEERKISAAVGAARTVGALVTFGGHLAAPGQIVYAGPGTFCLGELDGGHSTRTADLARAIEPFHPVRVTDNITGHLWAKEAVGAVYFATALVDADVPDIFDRHEYRGVLGRLVAEVVAVAHAQGVRVEVLDGFDPNPFPSDATAVERSWAAQRAYWTAHAQRRTGVWRDLAIHHRPTEVDHILAPIVDLARSSNVAAPTLTRLVDLVHQAERGERPLGWQNLDLLDAAA